MSRIDDLLTLEKSGQLPPDFQKDLNTLRAAGEVPPLSPEPSTLTKLAAMPSQAINQIPYIGPIASQLVPSTSSGWGATALLTAASLLMPEITGPAMAVKYGPTAIRAGASALGGMLGSAAGGERDPTKIATEGGAQGIGQVLGEGLLGAGSSIGGWLMRNVSAAAKPILNRYGPELEKFIPNILESGKLSPTRFFEVVKGGKGDRALSDAFDAGVQDIYSRIGGSDTLIQNPTITAIVRRYRRLLPSADDAFKLPNLQGGQAPASLVLNPTTGHPISAENLIKLAKEMGAVSRNLSKGTEGSILGETARVANIKMRQEIGSELNRLAPPTQINNQFQPGAGDIYQGINSAYRQGHTVLDVLKDNWEQIFRQRPSSTKIDAAGLATAHNSALAELERVSAGDLALAARRGGPPGAGDIERRLPLSAWLMGGGGGPHIRGHQAIQIPSAAGASLTPGPGGRVAAGYLTQRMLEDYLYPPELPQ